MAKYDLQNNANFQNNDALDLDRKLRQLNWHWFCKMHTFINLLEWLNLLVPKNQTGLKGKF